MKKYDLEDSFQRCSSEGIIKKKDEVDIELIRSLLKSAKDDNTTYKNIEKNVKKSAKMPTKV